MVPAPEPPDVQPVTRVPHVSSAPFPIVEWLLVCLSFALFASLRSPVPGVNEPHYLTKAKHFWDESWCSRDPFLQSANAHYVFYATIGLLTRAFSLEQTAWLGRVLGWLLLASGWTALAGRLLPWRWGAVWSAWVFLALAAVGNWSGEWVVGGIEAKVLSYGCAWWSLACALSGQPRRAAAWSGAAVSFHPVVGIWNTAAVALALFVPDWRIWRVLRQADWRTVGGCGLAWMVLAGPGLIPAVLMLRGANPADSYAADYIQVFYRLAHHLDPWRFAASGYWGYAGLLAVIVTLAFYLGRTEPWRMAGRYVAVAVLIACGGIAIRAIPDVARFVQDAKVLPAARNWFQSWIDYQPHLAGLLKFYPFRLADVAVPWMASLLVTLGVIHLTVSQQTKRLGGSVGLPGAGFAWLMFGACFAVSLALPAVDRNPSRMTAEQYADWTDACGWVKQQTPGDAMCFSANDGWSLRWFAERADYLSNKDCPQDAAGIIAWNERFKQIAQWSEQSFADGFSAAELKELRQQTGIDYLIVRRLGPIHLEPKYRNRTFQVYQLPE